MANQRPNPSKREYIIFRPEKIGWLHIMSLFILRGRSLTSYKFVETDSDGDDTPTDIITLLTIWIQKILKTIRTPLKYFGIGVEFLLNFVSLNGGIIGLIKNIFKVSVVIPNRAAANFRTIMGFIDDRVNLFNPMKSPSIQFYPFMDASVDPSDQKFLDLTMMAAKIAYENATFIKNVVDNIWKMHFVEFYSCWNKFLEDHTTQAFIFTNKVTDADKIVVAFRGTEFFNADDWSTDVDLSWLSDNKLGKLHLGFLKALGLQNEKSFRSGFPKDLPNIPAGMPVAYYTIRKKLKNLLKVHKNAKIAFTGHSLGGALACIFPALLSYHEEGDIMSSLNGVFTYGQPRVGDEEFASYMRKIVNQKYARFVYRYDIVTRIPFDYPPVSLFKHCGICVYYKSWYEGQLMMELDDAPNPNYFDPAYIVSLYSNAWGDLSKAIVIRWTEGKEYEEGIVSIGFRAVGLIIPGIASHSPRDYVNAGRLYNKLHKSMEV